MSLNWIEYIPALSLTAYAANDVVGAPIAITGNRSGMPFYIDQIHLIDMDQAKAALRFLFFSTQITVQADNAALATSDIEIPYLCAILSTGTYVDVGTSYSYNQILPARPIAVTPYKGKNIWVVMQTTGTPTYGSTSSLKVRIVYRYQEFGMTVSG